MEKMMNAYMLTCAERIEPRTVPVPTIADHQALVRVKRVGICGSDIEYYRHFVCGAFAAKEPFVLGHEFSGEIAAVGAAVQGLKPGTRVTVDPSTPCYKCDYCHSGRYNLCRKMVFLGSASTNPHTDGGMRDYVVMNAANCLPIPDSMSFAEAAFIEPLSIALHACNHPRTLVGQSVLVFGAGTIGMLVMLTARAYGAARVTMIDPVAARRERAVQLGASAAFDPADVDGIAKNGEYQVVMEASGAPPAVVAAITTVARGGAVVLIGTITRDVTIPANLIMVREITVFGSFRTRHTFETGIALIADGRINVKPIITHEFPISQVAEAFAATRDGSALKVQLTVG